MLKRLVTLFLLLALVVPPAPASALYRVEGLPKPLRDLVWTMTSACISSGGRAGDAMKAVEAIDLDEDALPDLIFDESAFPCSGLNAPLCPQIGCSTYVYLNRKGEWKMVFDVVGSYCLDRTRTPPQFLTIQNNYLTDGGSYALNVKYRFTKGMAFQEGRGSCP
jgi:hypothetical protein